MPAVTYTGTFAVSFKNEHTIYENEIRCLVQESDYNLSYNPTLLSGSYISGSVLDLKYQYLDSLNYEMKYLKKT